MAELSETFSHPVRTRGYEADPSRAVPLSCFMAYFGMLRWEVLLEPKFALVEALRGGFAFVIRQQQVEVLRRVGIGVDLDIHLWWERVGRSSVDIAQQAVRREDGAVVAQGRVTCAWLSPQRRLARLPDDHRAAARAVAGGGRFQLAQEIAPTAVDRIPVNDESWFDPAPMLHKPGGLALPLPSEVPDHAWRKALDIRRSDVDVFGHVNATHYLNLMDDIRGDGLQQQVYGADAGALSGRSTRVAIRYDREVRAGEQVQVATWPTPACAHDGDAPRALSFAIQLPDGGAPASLGTVVCEASLQ